MPELPEVETIVRDLNASHLVGKSIKKATVYWPRSIATPIVEEFCRNLADQQILQIDRRGKWLVFTLSTFTLLVHLRMTGKFTLSKHHVQPSSHERVRLELDDGRLLRFEDQRKFGKWHLLAHPEAQLNDLGLEPLSEHFTFEAFKSALKDSSQQLKPFLLDQRHIVGLGNIYVDEALWHAKIHPQQKVNTINPKQLIALHEAIPMVLKEGIAHMGTSLGSKQANYFSVSGRRGGNQTQLKVFRRDGLPCPRCQTTIIKLIVSQRGTHLCPHCQPLR